MWKKLVAYVKEWWSKPKNKKKVKEGIKKVAEKIDED